jgi:hypothetical protein
VSETLTPTPEPVRPAFAATLDLADPDGYTVTLDLNFEALAEPEVSIENDQPGEASVTFPFALDGTLTNTSGRNFEADTRFTFYWTVPADSVACTEARSETASSAAAVADSCAFPGAVLGANLADFSLTMAPDDVAPLLPFGPFSNATELITGAQAVPEAAAATIGEELQESTTYAIALPTGYTMTASDKCTVADPAAQPGSAAAQAVRCSMG